MIEPITVDFETDAIVGNPVVTPPKSVGCSIFIPGQAPFYLSWGHPVFAVGDPRWPQGSDNNCDFGHAHEYLRKLRDTGKPLLFHNAPFDISVWNNDFCNAQISWLDHGWRKIHDTMFLLFLSDPYSDNLSLKPSADHYLGMAPTEQDELYAWILRHVPGATPKTAGAYISLAPADLVSPYAIGDVVRTRKLFDLLHQQIVSKGMEGAYDRERRLMPILMGGTRRGIRVDREQLQIDEEYYSKAVEYSSNLLAKSLGCSRDALDHDESLADALTASGAVKEWVVTKTGKRSMAKDNLKIVLPEVKTLMEYRSGVSTCLQTFMRPWIEFSRVDGRVHPSWNQVRTRGDFRDVGTRTGRLSSSGPNFQNVPTEFTDNLGKPLAVPEGLSAFPIMRQYCLPEQGHLWVKRDFSSQEIRIVAHFEDGSLCEAYRTNADLDPHTMAQELILAMVGITYARKSIKITAFSIIYGSGATGLSIQLGSTYQAAWEIKEAYLTAMPGIRNLMRDVQARGRSGAGIRTWGGRLYFSEPAKEDLKTGRVQEFHYKLLNYLVQGSAADQTKESLNDWEDGRVWSDTFLATVHDEINISVPADDVKGGMERLRLAMDADRFDVPMRSEGFIGENWHEIQEEHEWSMP